jgi:hypothetical protein
MIGFFLLLVLLMVLVAVCVPLLQGGGRRVIYERRPHYVDSDVVEVVDGYDDVDAEPLRPVARRRVVRRRRY